MIRNDRDISSMMITYLVTGPIFSLQSRATCKAYPHVKKYNTLHIMYVILSNLEKLTKIWLLHRPSQLLYEGTSLRYFAPEPRIDLKSISTVYTWLTHLFNRQLSPAQEFWKVTEMRKIKLNNSRFGWICWLNVWIGQEENAWHEVVRLTSYFSSPRDVDILVSTNCLLREKVTH